MPNNRIKRVSGIYVCDDCGKKTRDTGAGEEGSGLCARCYTKAEWLNFVSDGGKLQDVPADFRQEVANEFGITLKKNLFDICGNKVLVDVGVSLTPENVQDMIVHVQNSPWGAQSYYIMTILINLKKAIEKTLEEGNKVSN